MIHDKYSVGGPGAELLRLPQSYESLGVVNVTYRGSSEPSRTRRSSLTPVTLQEERQQTQSEKFVEAERRLKEMIGCVYRVLKVH